MLIKYNGKNVHKIMLGLDQHKVQEIVFMPGVNKIDDALWEKCLKNPIVQGDLDEEVFEEIGDKAVSKLSDAKAVKMVKETVDAGLLTEWLSTEKRAKVKSAIEKRLKEIGAVDGEETDETEETA